MAGQPIPWKAKWTDVPLVWLDFETTGIQPGIDRAVEVGLARFEGARCVDEFGARINPGIPIPAEATAIHGITDADVADAITVERFFALPEARGILDGAQPAAYNAPFDKWFCPPFALADWTWPWLDTLTLVRHVDRFAKGKGRHKLEAACQRHGVELQKAHSAQADARAAGELFFVLAKRVLGDETIGELLSKTVKRTAEQWVDFNDWLGKQPPLEGAAP